MKRNTEDSLHEFLGVVVLRPVSVQGVHLGVAHVDDIPRGVMHQLELPCQRGVEADVETLKEKQELIEQQLLKACWAEARNLLIRLQIAVLLEGRQEMPPSQRYVVRPELIFLRPGK